jgi:hypothetical protein
MVKSKKQANFILQLEKLPSLPFDRTCQALVELNYLEGRESGDNDLMITPSKILEVVTLTHR